MPRDNAAQLAVLDTSVAVRWLVPEIGSDEAIGLMSRDISWISPRFVVTEFAAALRRKVVSGGLQVAAAVQAAVAFKMAIADSLIELAHDEELLPDALVLALAVGHKLPDCMYLALAERNGAAIATADVPLSRIAAARGVTVHLVPSQ